MGPTAAEAAIVHVTPQNPIRLELATVTATPDGFVGYGATSVDVDANGQSDLGFLLLRYDQVYTSVSNGVTYNIDVNLGFAAMLGDGIAAEQVVTAGGSYGIARRFDSGDLISAGLSFSTLGPLRGLGEFRSSTAGGAVSSGSYDTGQFPANGSGLAGFAFDRGGDTHFGWVRLNLEADAEGFPTAIEIVEWAYEDVAGAAITAGAVPEPTGLGLLAAGAAGVAALKRRAA